MFIIFFGIREVNNFLRKTHRDDSLVFAQNLHIGTRLLSGVFCFVSNCTLIFDNKFIYYLLEASFSGAQDSDLTKFYQEVVFIKRQFINKKREIVWVENFTRFDSLVRVYYKGTEYPCTKKIFGTKLFPMDEATKNYLKYTLNIDVDIPSFVRKPQKDSKAAHSSEFPSYYISPNGTCLEEMDWDFD